MRNHRALPHSLGLVIAACALSAGCAGQIDDDSRSQHSIAGAAAIQGGAGALPGPMPADVPAADAAMQAANPELFQVALQFFPGQSVTGGPQRLFRLTRRQLDLTTRALLPAHYADSTEQSLPRDPLQTNYEYADNLSWNAANFTPYTQWVSAIATRVRAAPASVIDCTAERDSESCLRAQATRFVARAFRGVVAPAQLTRFADFLVASAGEVGVPAATADLVDVTLTSPNYVFREEVQTDAARTLQPAQLLQNVTYALADSPPEALGLASENAAALVGSSAALRQTVEQVLSTPAAREKLLRFFLAWLEVKEADEFAISESVFPEFTPEVAAAAVAETRQFLERQLAGAAPSLKGITQSTESFVSEALAFIYGVRPGPAGQTTKLDPAQRFGIFTQPAVIASHSGPTTTRLVKRGVFFTRKVMCLPLGAPPPGIDTTLPTTPGATERQRIESKTAMQPCAGCHAFINPFGFMQENYDAIGRWRTTDEGLPIDARISVDFLEEGPFSASTPIDALRGFTASSRFKQCFARQLYRFYMGRDESPSDDPVLRQMFFDFASEDRQDIVAMLRILAGSPSFSQRSEAP